MAFSSDTFSVSTDLRTLLCHHPGWNEHLRTTDGLLWKKAELTQIVVALVHLGDVDFCGSLGNLHNSVVAQAGEGMLKHTRHNLAACVIASAHPAFVHNFVGA